jgi:pyrroline-5-carboxylate reductase
MRDGHLKKIAFIGGGNMARALAGGLLRAGMSAGDISIGEPQEAQRAALQRDLGVRVSADNATAIAGAETVVLAVKPQEAAAVLAQLALPAAQPAPLLVSIAAGLQVSTLQRWCGGVHIVRAMPNRPALLGAGVSALYARPEVTAQERALAETLLRAAGRIVWVRHERELDLVTALSGSGPAYFFLMAEQLAAAAHQAGLDLATATLLAAETLYGAGQLAHTGMPLAQQRAAVTSKGGTTEAALAALEAAGFGTLITRAFDAAAARSAELAATLAGSA